MEINESRIRVLDGGMGTMLQRSGAEIPEVPEMLNIERPDVVESVHRQYVEAGSDIVYTNTFGVNRYKTEGCGYTVDELVKGAVRCAKKACGEKASVALDIGPLGKMLEPAGDLPFEEAYDAFAEIVRSGADEGPELIIIETMTDLYEMKAALLAAVENSDLPVICSMSFEKDGRTFTGCSVEAMAATLEGLGASAVGINCSLGPAEILPLAKRLKEATDLPTFFKPNAGLPDPATGEYDISAEEFAETMKEFVKLGPAFIGGCCGTDPGFIKCLRKIADESERETAAAKKERVPRICSATKIVTFDHTVVCGERLNPTGKKRLREALLGGDMNYVLRQAIAQEEQGAEMLDINVGVPGIDEVEVLPKVVKAVQTVTNLPLQIDSSNADAVEAALRVYNGKAIINSVNGERGSMDKILPLAKKYGACVIGLTLDEDGIPESTEKRIEVAAKILDEAERIGVPREDVVIDCLTLTASAQQAGVRQTLDAIRTVKERFGNRTALGVSNISFGLPARPLVNKTFLVMALECGLDMPIIDPGNAEMMAAVATFEMLVGRDKNAVRYIENYSDYEVGQTSPAAAKQQESGAPQDQSGVFYTIEKGLEDETAEETRKLLGSHDELEIVNDWLIPALDRIGKGFETGKIFLPQMIQAATAAQAGFEVIKESMKSSGGEQISLGKVVIATVKGDVHDIGKNIVKVIMENYGFEMIDLGKDVPPETVVEAMIENDAQIVGLSALMTTTLPSMEETIRQVKAERPEVRILAGGAVLTEEYAMKIGADYYCKDAMKAVEAAKDALGVK